MSESDERMERAERIRKMRQSREPDDEPATGDGAGGADHEATDHDGEDDVASDADDEDRVPTKPDAGTPDGGSGSATSSEGATEDVESRNDAPAGDTAETETVRTVEHSTETATPQPASDSIEPDPTVDVESVRSEQPAPADTGQQTRTADANGSQAKPTASVAESASQGTSASGPAPLGGTSGFSLPGQEEIEAAAESAGGEATTEDGTAGAATARGDGSTSTEPSVRVLEFTIGDQIYCIDIDRVEEIVKRESITRVPNTEAYVEGVVDLRGQITTILDTKQLLDVEERGSENLLVIFAPDAFEEHGTVGWVVDEVRQVVPVMDSQVRRPPSDDEHVRGIVDRDDETELVVWIRPADAMDRAVAVEND